MNGTVYVYKTSPATLESDIEKVLTTPDFQELDPEKETFIKINANYDKIGQDAIPQDGFWMQC